MRTLLASFFLTLPLLAAPGLKEKDEPAPTAEESKKTANNLLQIGLALHNYHDSYGKLPSNVMKDGKPILSWRVALLPFLEEGQIARQFDMNEPWDGPNNKKLLDKMPKVYKAVRSKAEASETFYQMFNYSGGFLRPKGEKATIIDATDGTSNTFMVVEGYAAVTWSKPDDIMYDPKAKELPKLGRMFQGDFHVVYGDGSVARIKKDVDPKVLHNFIQLSDGNTVNRRDVEVPLLRPEGPREPLPPPLPPQIKK